MLPAAHLARLFGHRQPLRVRQVAQADDELIQVDPVITPARLTIDDPGCARRVDNANGVPPPASGERLATAESGHAA